MPTIKDVKEIPSKMLKGDTFDVYKAYFFNKEQDEDYKMSVNENVDMFGITPEAAVNELLRSIPSEVFVAQVNGELDELLGGNGIDSDKKWIYRDLIVNLDGKVKDRDVFVVEMTDVVVPILTIHLNMEDLKDKNLIEDSEEVVFHDDVIGLTLTDKLYEIECGMQRLVSFKITIGTDGFREVSEIKLEEVDKPHKKEE